MWQLTSCCKFEAKKTKTEDKFLSSDAARLESRYANWTLFNTSRLCEYSPVSSGSMTKRICVETANKISQDKTDLVLFFFDNKQTKPNTKFSITLMKHLTCSLQD